MGALTRELGRASLVGVVTVGLMVASLIALLRFRANSRWLVLIGAIMALLTNGFHLR
jgi:chromate transporter